MNLIRYTYIHTTSVCVCKSVHFNNPIRLRNLSRFLVYTIYLEERGRRRHQHLLLLNQSLLNQSGLYINVQTYCMIDLRILESDKVFQRIEGSVGRRRKGLKEEEFV